MQPEVCVVGEINCDLILYGLPEHLEPEKEMLAQEFRLTLGGSSAIFAHNLSTLGTRTGIASGIGGDPFGKIAIERLSEGGVDVSAVRGLRSGTATGVTVIFAQSAQRYIFTYSGTIAEFCYEDIDRDYVFSARHLHLSSFFLQSALRPSVGRLFREAKQKGLTTSLDTNDDPDGRWANDLLDVLPFVDVFLLNEREAKAVTRCDELSQAARKLSGLARIVAIKCGADGAIAHDGQKEWRCPGVRVRAVDTVGAGDSFDAGFIHKFVAGASYEDCLRFANVAGAFSTTREGGTEAFRDLAAMKEFFDKQSHDKR
ncbi:MAG: carbohydrate kinase family protein [Candidatus Acidiferrales bacterium]